MEQYLAEGIGFAPGHLFGQAGAYDDCLRLNAGYRWTNELEAAVERLGVLARISTGAWVLVRKHCEQLAKLDDSNPEGSTRRSVAGATSPTRSLCSST
ncbi:hypothetical protein [Paraburkholderia sp. SIMBA_030]|uniref:hypothetical protein n=1 Tax=Paraburkholderia sp. SIMBA_030 TaxID=3085773 RepID=UPI00397C9268